MYDVTALGELLIDFTQTAITDTGFPSFTANPGGAPPNYLAALASFGASVRFVGKVGNDAFGVLLQKTLENASIDTKSLIFDPKVFTTLAFVSLDETGNRHFSFARKPGADTALSCEDLPDDIANTRIFHFGTLSMTHEPARSATRQAVMRARHEGALISLDPNVRLSLWDSESEAKDAMHEAIALADIVKISDEEIDFLYGVSIDTAFDILHDTGVSLVFATMGAQGCRYSKYDGIRNYIEGIQGIKTIDTTGAGDIFGGSAAYGLLQHTANIHSLTKIDLDKIVSFANAAAALSTTKQGGIPSVPTLAEVQTLLSSLHK